MTAEIAILNTSAVALAADSAVTISKSSGGPKIFNTANKLFTLSKYAPVGVMIYGAADLMGVPWETLIKMFRRDLGRRRFAQLQEYAEHFVKYVQSNASVFPASLQDEYAANTVRSALMSTRANVDRTIKSVTDSGATLTARRFKSLVALRIKEAYEAWEARPRLDELPAGFEDALRTQYSEMIRSTIDAVFGDLPLAADSKIRLGELAIARLSRRWLPANKAGVVIAGFGEDDIFPALTFYEVEAVVLHHLRRIPGGTVRVGVD